jgi:hypothetical protein
MVDGSSKNINNTRIASTEIKKDAFVSTIFVCLSSSDEKILFCLRPVHMEKEYQKREEDLQHNDEAMVGHRKLVEEMKIIINEK